MGKPEVLNKRIRVFFGFSFNRSDDQVPKAEMYDFNCGSWISEVFENMLMCSFDFHRCK